MSSRLKIFICYGTVLIAGLLLIFTVDHVGILKGVDHSCYDLFFRIRGPQKHSADIVIAAIDEKTLRKLGRWPIARRYYAEMLNYLAPAETVVLDVIMTGTSKEDHLLAAAIRKHGNVVLPAYINDLHEIMRPPEKLYAAAAIGHGHLEQVTDGIVRSIFHTIIHQGTVLRSLPATAYDHISHRFISSPVRLYSDRRYDPEKLYELNPMKINYYGGFRTFAYVSLVEIVEGRYPPSFFKNKIVFAGLTVTGFGRNMLTPFTRHRESMPGVEIHAHILNNLLDHNDIRDMGTGWIRSAVIVMALISFCLFVRSNNVWAALTGIGLISTSTLALYLLFAHANIWIPPTLFFFAYPFAFLLSYVFKLEIMRERLKVWHNDWKTSLDSIDDAITIHDAKGNIIQMNRAARHCSPALKEYLNRNCRIFFDTSAPTAEAKKALPDVENINGQTDTKTALFHDDQQLYEIKSLPRRDKRHHFTGMVHIVRDITRRKRYQEEQKTLQSQLIQAQKTEAIATLAGGIAHDFNNILSAIMGYTQLATFSLSNPEKAGERLEQVLKACNRARDLILQIFMFSRRQGGKDAPVQMGLIVKEALKLLKSTLPATIEIRQDIDTHGSVIGNPTQIHQILMNLCTNAFHAMQKRGGILTIRLEEFKLNTAAKSETLHLKPGAYLKLSVSDTGEGIPPHIKQRIFEPYFTTKIQGEGTGLGLATTHAIVKSFGGEIQVHSSVGEGTTFTVYLPCVPTEKAENTDDGNTHAISSARGRILFVDDEPDIISTFTELLTHLGYEVISRTSPLEALQVFEADPQYFDLVITDMTMPKMTGKVLAEKISAIRPDMPIILSTGYHQQANEKRIKMTPIRKVIYKPLSLKILAETIQDVLQNPSSKPESI